MARAEEVSDFSIVIINQVIRLMVAIIEIDVIQFASSLSFSLIVL